MDLRIAGLRVLVTAGAGGIGLEVVRAFLREAARVHICDVDEDALGALAKDHPEVTRSKTDVSDRTQVTRMFDDAVKALGGLDCLVNNAGIAGPTGRVDAIEPEDWDRTLAINITGQFNCARLAVPHLQSSANPSIMSNSRERSPWNPGVVATTTRVTYSRCRPVPALAAAQPSPNSQKATTGVGNWIPSTSW